MVTFMFLFCFTSTLKTLENVLHFYSALKTRLLFDRSFVASTDENCLWEKIMHYGLMQKNIFQVLYCIGCRTQLHYLKKYASTINEIRDRGIRYVHVSAKRRRWKSCTGCSSRKIVTNAPALKSQCVHSAELSECIFMRAHLSITLLWTITPPSVYQKHNIPLIFCFLVPKCAYTYRSIHFNVLASYVCVFYTTAVAYVSRFLKARNTFATRRRASSS